MMFPDQMRRMPLQARVSDLLEAQASGRQNSFWGRKPWKTVILGEGERSMAVSARDLRYRGGSAVDGSLARDLDWAVRERELRHAGEAPRPREAAEALAPLTRSEVVQVIGTKFVLYRPSHKKDKKDKIVLVQDKKRAKG